VPPIISTQFSVGLGELSWYFKFKAINDLGRNNIIEYRAIPESEARDFG
jgi:hypothetical protein